MGERGEILMRGHNVMKGYYNRPEETAEAFKGGWFHTGDVATVDEDGYFYIVDRIKDMINRGGFNVYPREIEEVMLTHPAISMAAYKYPRTVEIRESLPMTATGKILKKELRAGA